MCVYYRSIYLSGGATVLPGFAARLQAELSKIAPPSIVVQVSTVHDQYTYSSCQAS